MAEQDSNPGGENNADRHAGGAPASAVPPEAPEQADDTYEPSTVEVNRARLQGLGVGQKDLDYQRDPTRSPSAEQYGRDADDKGATTDPGRRQP